MPFIDENVLNRLPKNDAFQVGRSNSDSNNDAFERGAQLPWASGAAASWVYFECAVGAALDSGVVVHNHLPQVDREFDTLGAIAYDDPALDVFKGTGVNLRCQDQYNDVVQRMGHARYWFRLWGRALRIGYRVPIPRLVTVGGAKAIPYDKNPQWAFNRIAPGGNFGGVILWHAVWSLWYTTATPPTGQEVRDTSPAAHISSDVPPAKAVQPPYSQPDDDAQTRPPIRRGVAVGP